jgi:hypothetical protein
MSTIKANKHQIGSDGTTPNNNFVLETDGAGNLVVNTGNHDGTLTPVTTIGVGGTKYTPAGTGAVVSTVQGKLRESVSVLDFGAVGNGIANDTAACQAAVNAGIAQKKSVYFPGGTYLLTGVGSSDTIANGILVPFNTINTDSSAGVELFGDAGATVLKANSNNMFVLRISRNYVTVRDIVVDGDNKTLSYGIGIVPESTTQTTTQVSQSYVTLDRGGIQNCVEGLWVKPGPTISGSDSGCFYQRVSGVRFYNNVRHLLCSADASGLGNRITRSLFTHCNMFTGTHGVQIDKGTELDFVACNFELLTGNAFNYADTNPANIHIFGGYAEACTVAITAAFPYAVTMYGFEHNSTKDASEFTMGRVNTGRLTVPKLPNVAGYINVGGESFAGFVVDPDQTGAKVLAVQTNGTERQRWNADGTTSIFGDIKLIGSTTFITNSAGASQVNVADSQFWRSVAGSDVMRLATSGTLSLFPAVDNNVVLGQNGFRWSAVWSANGTIQTSDPRTKKEVIDSPLGLEFINSLRPVAYKFKVGGNVVVDGEIVPVPGTRQHFGFLTTNVKDSAGDVDFGGYVKTDLNDADSEEALRYDEFIAPLVRAVQELTTRLAALEAT